ncbi:MAG: glycosyltransferase [Candidatus Falkowbacteria bacterium]
MNKILVVGDFHSKIHEKAIYESFIRLGFDADKFSWHQYFGKAPYEKNFLNLSAFFNICKKIQYHFRIGPLIGKINKDLIIKVLAVKPDLVFIYRGTHILPNTVKIIKDLGITVFAYNNDDPFSEKYPFYFWRHFLAGTFLYDHIFVYRQKNIEDYKKINYKKVSILRSYYIKNDNFNVSSLPSDKYKCDVIFIGHFEDDGRDEYIKMLLDANIDLKLFGPEWEKSKHYKYFIKKLGSISSLKDDYNLAINSAEIALVFLSSLNNDTYTRRVFEIIAAKVFMLSVYSDDLNGLFTENKEAVYFRSKDDLLNKVRFYLANPELRKNIAQAGYQRLMVDGHEVDDRVKEIIRVYNRIKNEKNINT